MSDANGYGVELKPCPFCGSAVQFEYKAGNYGYTPSTVAVRCKKCGIGFSRPTEEWKQGRGHYSVRYAATMLVAEQWNTRKPDVLEIPSEESTGIVLCGERKAMEAVAHPPGAGSF